MDLMPHNVRLTTRRSGALCHASSPTRELTDCNTPHHSRFAVVEDAAKDVSSAATTTALIKRGHVYSNFQAKDSARVHAGDLIIYGNYYATSSARGLQTTGTISKGERTEQEQASLQLAIIGNLLIEIFGRLLSLMLLALPCLPKQIKVELATFEDPFGNISHIDINLITDWVAFEFTLHRAFSKKSRRGLRRLVDRRYRLHDDERSQTVDPAEDDDFTAIFAPGRHIRMSIFFQPEEVYTSEYCPACRTPRGPMEPLAEHKCPSCHCNYRTLEAATAESRAPRGLADIAPASRFGETKDTVVPTQPYGPRVEDLDHPGHFVRVSIGTWQTHRGDQVEDLASLLASGPYAVLGVPQNATTALIKTAHRRLVLKHHPDKLHNTLSQSARKEAADMFHQIQASYETLIDSTRRERYDTDLRAKIESELKVPRQKRKVRDPDHTIFRTSTTIYRTEPPPYKRPPPQRSTDALHPSVMNFFTMNSGKRSHVRTSSRLGLLQ